MRFRVGLVLSLLAVLVALGCRDPLSPNADRNFAPETWITAAPQDTITEKDANGRPKIPAFLPDGVGTIPVRFHLHWAGSDRDGAVSGFYFAVVETVPLPPPGLPMPNLPGPKPRDYKYTSKTDSVFIFNVSEFASDREHAFYIYAVDDKGKADATPARFIFNAQDRYPPDVVIYEAKGTGPFYRMIAPGQVVTEIRSIAIRDSATLANLGSAPPDTVPATSELVFNWRAEPVIAGTHVTGFKYKLDEAAFIEIPAESTSKTYGLGVTTIGTKIFTLRALDGAGGAKETNRRFLVNRSPDTWFAGPPPGLFGPTGYIEVSPMTDAGLRAMPELQGTMLSSDSLVTMPPLRPRYETFYELYDPDGTGPLGTRIYIRQPGDTVHINSWVLFHSGGRDDDSPYDVPVSFNDASWIQDTAFVNGPAYVVRAGPPNGSPVGFSQQAYTFATPNGPTRKPTSSGAYPVFNTARVDWAPFIGAYLGVRAAGQVFLVTRAIDGNGSADNRIRDPKAFYETNCTGLDPDPLCSRVITFYVDKAPYLQTWLTGFVPQPGGPSSVFQTRTLNLNLIASDDDPYDRDPSNFVASPGGPSATRVLRWTVTIKGKNAAGNDTTYAPTPPLQQFDPNFQIQVPTYIVGPAAQVVVQLCDCAYCEITSGEGRCITQTIDITIPTAEPARATSAVTTPGPGNPQAWGRSSR